MSTRHAERQGEVNRVTRSGRNITYCLRVIQQPERARACGAGAKSSADRRPVDPPPVVELRVFEGEGEKKEDITFSYEANFFLFASLEAARPIAQARHQPAPPQQPPPVLTGMPVSGMAYLDRPTEAGYFIFPDLSVRHEGRYKLSFNLYEQTKREHDLDAEPSPEGQSKVPNGPESPDSSFDFRMEVKSSTFNVWSAKKFPGLKESTALSRQVAEQGCRVRIRRDVRMRRRGDGKPGEYDESYEEQYARGRAEEAERESRSRSSSASGMDPAAGKPNGQPYYQSQPGNNLSFIPSSGGPQFAAPPPQFAVPQHQHQAPPPASSHHYQQQAPAPIYRPQPSQQNSYQYDRQYPQSAYPANQPRESFEQESRRASAPYPSSGAREFSSVSGESSHHRASVQHYAPPRPFNAAPPPPQSPSLVIPPIRTGESKFDRQHSLPSVQPRIVAEPYSSYGAPKEPVRAGGKRAFDSVFKSTATASTQPLFNGQRPSTTHIDPAYEEDDDEGEYSIEALQKMSYKRADGNLTSRDIPNKL